jgi:hypothetical protein
MKKIIIIGLLVICVVMYLFFYLGIELELKSVIERTGVKSSQLFDASIKIRNFTSLQLLFFLLTLVMCIFLVFKKK